MRHGALDQIRAVIAQSAQGALQSITVSTPFNVAIGHIFRWSSSTAFIALVLNNAQGELHPLEEGLHALGSGAEIGDYANKIGKVERTVLTRVWAARVATNSNVDIDVGLFRYWSVLAELHVAPEWLWLALALAAKFIQSPH